MVDYLTVSDIPIRISCISTENWPIIISLWYVYMNEKFYCATQNTSKIIKYMRHSPKCGFEISKDHFPYKGIRGYGNALIQQDKGEYILRILLEKYLKEQESSKIYKSLLSEKHLQNEVAIEITPSRIFEWDFKERMSMI
jgi:nitroimidazol reductase NimA-like FMN-containing flavoprotein (pyridoxamine 5'-phosphate oxidase superfamily)